MSKLPIKPAFAALLLCSVFSLAGCATNSDPFESISHSFKLTADPVEPQPFVKAARPDPSELDYIPVGFQETKRATPVRSKAEADADAKGLTAAGESAKARSVAEPPKPAPLKKRRKPLPEELEPAK